MRLISRILCFVDVVASPRMASTSSVSDGGTRFGGTAPEPRDVGVVGGATSETDGGGGALPFEGLDQAEARLRTATHVARTFVWDEAPRYDARLQPNFVSATRP